MKASLADPHPLIAKTVRNWAVSPATSEMENVAREIAYPTKTTTRHGRRSSLMLDRDHRCQLGSQPTVGSRDLLVAISE
jgi:hypothetical protein